MNKFKYTFDHIKEFLRVEKKILGKNRLKSYFHDFDKLILYIFFSKKTVSKLHRKYSSHHDNSFKNNYLDMIIDWECARFTKPDKFLDAYQTMKRYYPHMEREIEPLLIKYRLI